jgi:hypothetical protein
MAVEQPEYIVLEKSGRCELRRYPPLLVAEVSVEGRFDEISGKGFRLIADFIFGNNSNQSGAGEKIAMTAPVTVEPSLEEIKLDALVTQQQAVGKWRMYFVMPARYTLQSLPVPNNPLVQLRQIPARNVAVIAFPGLVKTAATQSKTRELLAWMEEKRLEPTSNFELARYNPPWTLPFLRRNEIMVEYAPAAA